MRGTIPGLRNPLRIADMLPGVFHEDDPTFIAFASGLDDVVATVPSVLDNLAAYVDPKLAPEDFVAWLATWVGVELDENWHIDRQRDWVGNAVNLFHQLGTEAGLRQQLESATGGRVELDDSGGVAVSQWPGADFAGDPVPHVAVRIFVADPAAIDVGAIDRLILSAKPAWVAHSLEILAE